MEQELKNKISELYQEVSSLEKEFNVLMEKVNDNVNIFRSKNKEICDLLKEYTNNYYTGKHIRYIDNDICEIKKVTSVNDIECQLGEYRMYATVIETNNKTGYVSEPTVKMFRIDVFGNLCSFAYKVID